MQSRNLAHYFPTTPASQLERVAALRQHRECYALLPKLPHPRRVISAYGDMKILLISAVCLAVIPIFFWVRRAEFLFGRYMRRCVGADLEEEEEVKWPVKVMK